MHEATMTGNRTLFKVDVSQTGRDREYWATRPWVSGELVQEIRAADVLLTPWENFRDGHPALFPQGTTDFARMLARHLTEKRIAVAIDTERFEEIALHARQLRWPTIMVTAVLLPLLVNILTEFGKKLLDEHPSDQTVQFSVIVEGRHRHCIEIDYKGPPNDLARMITEQAEKCLPRLEDKPRHVPANTSKDP